MKTTTRGAGAGTAAAPYDVDAIRADFPALHQKVHDQPLVYLDNAATTQKPRAVLDAVRHYYERDNANIHRGVHTLSNRATDAYERARHAVKDFLNAREDAEIVFLRGATEAVNLVANTLGRELKAGDEVLITHMEHHSNIVPWQLACAATGATLRVAPIDDEGALILPEFERLLNDRTRIVSVVYQSNSLGTVNPVKEIVAKAHSAGAKVLVDGAQSSSHLAVDVQDLDCDLYALSGHKLYAPTGAGALYGKRELLERMPPWQGGGDMILSVTFEKSAWNKVPFKFEAGTPNISGGIGLGAAVDYVTRVGIERIAAWEHELLEYATDRLLEVPGLRLIGTAPRKASVLSFVLGDIHPHDIGTILDYEGVAVRTGHHCTQPVMDRFGVPATARASLAMYNTRADVDALVRGLHKVLAVLGTP